MVSQSLWKGPGTRAHGPVRKCIPSRPFTGGNESWKIQLILKNENFSKPFSVLFDSKLVTQLKLSLLSAVPIANNISTVVRTRDTILIVIPGDQIFFPLQRNKTSNQQIQSAFSKIAVDTKVSFLQEWSLPSKYISFRYFVFLLKWVLKTANRNSIIFNKMKIVINKTSQQRNIWLAINWLLWTKFVTKLFFSYTAR